MADDLEQLKVLEGCCVHVWQRVDGDVGTTQAINAKLRALGAKTLPRLTKEVTHVIFQRKLQSTAQERNAEDADLRTIHGKVGKYEPRVFVVSPLWLHHSEDAGTRAKELKYLERKPADPIFLVASPNKTASAGAKRKRKSLARPRELVETADVHDALFSSSQQIRDLNADELSAPLYIRPMFEGIFLSSGGSAAGGQGGGVGAAAPERKGAAVLSDVEEGEEDCPRPAKAPSLASILGGAKQKAVPGASAAGTALTAAAKAAPKAGGGSGRPGSMAPPRPPGPAPAASAKGLRQGTLNFAIVPKANRLPQQQVQQQLNLGQQAAKPPPAGSTPSLSAAGHGGGLQGQQPQLQRAGSTAAAPGPSSALASRAEALPASGSALALRVSLHTEPVAAPSVPVAGLTKQQDAPGYAQERPLPLPQQQELRMGQQQQPHHSDAGMPADVHAGIRPVCTSATGVQSHTMVAAAVKPAAPEAAGASAKKRPHQSTPLSPDLMPRGRRQSAAAAAATTAAPLAPEDPAAGPAARYSPLPCAVVPRGAPSAAAVVPAEEAAATAVRLGQAAVPIGPNGGAVAGTAALAPVPGALPPRAKSAGRRSMAAQDPAALPGPSPSLPASSVPAATGKAAGAVGLTAAVAAALAAVPGTRAASASRRVSRASCAGTPLGGAVALAAQSGGKLGRAGMRTPLEGTPGPFGFTPVGTLTVPRLKSQSSGGYGSSQSASATPELLHGSSAAAAPASMTAAGAGNAGAVGAGAETLAPQQQQQQQQMAQEQLPPCVQGQQTAGPRRTTRRSGLPPTPPMSSQRGSLTPPALTLVPAVAVGGGASAAAAVAGGETPTLVQVGGRSAAAHVAGAADSGDIEAGQGDSKPPPSRKRATPMRGVLVLEQSPATRFMAPGGGAVPPLVATGGCGAFMDTEAQPGPVNTGRRGARKAATPLHLSPMAALGHREDAQAGGDSGQAAAALPLAAAPPPPQAQAPGSVLRRSGRLASASPLPPRPPNSAVKTSAAAPGAAGCSLAFAFTAAEQHPPSDANAAQQAAAPGAAAPLSIAPATGNDRMPGTARKRRRPAEAEADTEEQGAGPSTSLKAAAPEAAPLLSPAPRTRAQTRAASAASPVPSLAPSLAPPPQPEVRRQPPQEQQPVTDPPAAAAAAQAGSPASPPRGAVRPAASHISGTPLTSPKYYTRMQRKRFSRMGVDLDRLPPGQPFTLQPDGTVTVEAAAAAPAAGNGTDTAGTAAVDGIAAVGATGAAEAGAAPAAAADGVGAAPGTNHMRVAAPSPAGPPASATRSRRRALDWELARAGAEEAGGAPAAELAVAAGGSICASGTSAAAPMPLPACVASTAGAKAAKADAAAPGARAVPLHAVQEAEGEGEDGSAAPSQEEGGAAHEGEQGAEGGLRPPRLRHAGSTPAAAAATGRARRTPAASAKGAGCRSAQKASGAAAEPEGAAPAAAAAPDAPTATAPPAQRGRLSLRKPATATAAAQGPCTSKAATVASYVDTSAAEPTASGCAAAGTTGAPGAAAARSTPAARPPAPKEVTGRKRQAATASGEDQPPESPPAAAVMGAKRRRTMPAPTTTAPLLPPVAAAGASTAAPSTTIKAGRSGAGAAGTRTPAPAANMGTEAAAKPATGKAAGPITAGVKRPRASAAKGSKAAAGGAAAVAKAAATSGALVGSAAFNSAVFMDGVASAFPVSTASAGAPAAAAATAQACAGGATAAGAPALGQYPRGKDHPMRAGVRYLAHTSVDAAMAAAVSAAVRQLGGARLCTPGYEDGHITHLVVGVPDRRTVKVLLGVANGAVFVSPAWVTESLAAGRWLPEEGFRVPGPFAATADAVRAQLQLRAQAQQQQQQQDQQQPATAASGPAAGGGAGPSAPRSPRAVVTAKPLGGRLVAVHNAQCNGPRLAEAQARKADVEKLVVALGGRVVPVRSAALLIMVGSGGEAQHGGRAGGGGAAAAAAERRPRLGGVSGPSSMALASEEWLMRLAETHVWQEPPLAH